MEKRLKLPNNSMFVCFAPKENPRIAIAVTVENAGFGSTWAGPIARILMEKYLNDTMQEKSKADVERISNTNLMPKYYIRKQYIADSLRAFEWFKMTKDSSYIKKYVFEKTSTPGSEKNKDQEKQKKKEEIAIWNDERITTSKTVSPYSMSQRNPEISKGVDWSLVWLWFLLSVVGIMAIFGVTYHEGDNVIQTFLQIQNRLQPAILFFYCVDSYRHVHIAY